MLNSMSINRINNKLMYKVKKAKAQLNMGSHAVRNRQQRSMDKICSLIKVEMGVAALSSDGTGYKPVTYSLQVGHLNRLATMLLQIIHESLKIITVTNKISKAPKISKRANFRHFLQ